MIAENKFLDGGYVAHHTDLRDAFTSVQEAYYELAESHQQLERWVNELTHAHEEARSMQDACEAAQLTAERRLANLLQALPAAVIILDSDGAVRDFNGSAAELLVNLSRSRPWRDVVDESFAPRWDDGHDITLKCGRRVNIATQALAGEPGQIIMLKDVTETRALQDELNRHRRLASMGEMAAALAHQVRTPLASAILYLSNVRMGRGDEALRQKCVEQALSRLQHLEGLVADMLLFARGGAFDAAELSVADLLREIVQEEGAKEAFTVEVIDATGAARLRGNRDALASALRNLIDNARQACNGEGHMLVEAVMQGDEQLIIRFSDDGPGIPQNLRETIFEPFFTTRMGGSGLGLAVTQAVVRAHGGEIVLDTTPRQGTSFVVTLPARRHADEGIAAAHAKTGL
jgi:two-component system sensor histidine kinase FlrB